jgi:hypothetical protein
LLSMIATGFECSGGRRQVGKDPAATKARRNAIQSKNISH